jgi:acyl dehydratase
MPQRYFDDLQVGQVVEHGPRTVSREEIVAFAREFDPQPFHLDEEAARRTPYGGLIASGWHTAALCQRLVVDGMANAASLGSPGVDELRWVRPVRPGDTLRLRVECVEATPSRSKPDRGLARFRYELRNQHGELVLTMAGMAFFARRPQGPSLTPGAPRP